jgi:hypothetical protein
VNVESLPIIHCEIMLSMRYENMPPSTLSEDEGIDILRSLAA